MNRLFTLLILLSCSLFSFADGGLKSLVETAFQDGPTTAVSPFQQTPLVSGDADQMVSIYSMLATTDDYQLIVDRKPQNIVLTLPLPDGSEIDLKLTTAKSIFKEGYDFAYEENGQLHTYTPGAYYKGVVDGIDQSLVAISFFDDMVMGIVSYGGSSYNIGNFDGAIILYNDADLLVANSAACETPATAEIPRERIEAAMAERSSAVCRQVKIEFDCDYEMYLDNGSSVPATQNWVTAMFNQSAALFLVDGFELVLDVINVYTSTDPYASLSSSSSILPAYRSDKNAAGRSGDIAHLLSTRSAGLGGIGYVDGDICGSSFAYCFSNINNSYGTFPTYSWTIDVVSHEMGHVLGSPHTHNCGWVGGAIDDCFTPEGGCATGPPAPSTGGTIMSYCHLSSVGKDFSLGFADQPAALIQSYIDSETCLDPCGTVVTCPTPANPTTTINSLTSITASWDAVPAAVNYILQGRRVGAASFQQITPTATSRTVGGLNPSRTYEWQVAADCGTEVSPFTALNTFSTQDCQTYCPSAGGTTADEWIETITIGGVTNTSGNNGGYNNFGGTPAYSFTKGSTVSLSLTPGYSSTLWDEWWIVWIDYNIDGDFDDPGEEVYNSGSAGNTTVTGSFVVPTSASAANTGMRVTMKYNSAPTSCEAFTYGEVEDYCIAITNSLRMEQGYSFDFDLFPNPAANQLTLQIQASENQEAILRITDLLGRQALISNLVLNEGLGQQVIDLSDLPNGSYLVEIDRDGEKLVKQLLINR